jgi:hypothetical protein
MQLEYTDKIESVFKEVSLDFEVKRAVKGKRRG